MKIKCEVIQDLLPLYIDDLCSEESKELVNNHLQSCEQCKEIFTSMKTDLPLAKERERMNVLEVKHPFKKIRTTFLSLITIILVLFVLSGIVLLMYTGVVAENDYREMNAAWEATEAQLMQAEFIEDTTYSLTFDSSRSEVRIGIVVNQNLTEVEAHQLLQDVLERVAANSKKANLWNIYDGYFTIMNDNNEVMYKATKMVQEELKVVAP